MIAGIKPAMSKRTVLIILFDTFVFVHHISCARANYAALASRFGPVVAVDDLNVGSFDRKAYRSGMAVQQAGVPRGDATCLGRSISDRNLAARNLKRLFSQYPRQTSTKDNDLARLFIFRRPTKRVESRFQSLGGRQQ